MPPGAGSCPGLVSRLAWGLHGLTTAATIWLVASIGMACGAGFYKLACISALLAIIVLVVVLRLVKPIERYAAKQQGKSNPEEQE